MVRRDGGRADQDLARRSREDVRLVLADLVRADEDAVVAALLRPRWPARRRCCRRSARRWCRRAAAAPDASAASIIRLRDAVLHRPARIEVLDLGQHRGLDALGDLVEPDERGVADQVADVLRVLHVAQHPSIHLPAINIAAITAQAVAPRHTLEETLRTGARRGEQEWAGRARRDGSRPRRRTAGVVSPQASSDSARSPTAACGSRPRSPAARSAPRSSKPRWPTAGTTPTGSWPQSRATPHPGCSWSSSATPRPPDWAWTFRRRPRARCSRPGWPRRPGGRCGWSTWRSAVASRATWPASSSGCSSTVPTRTWP